MIIVNNVADLNNLIDSVDMPSYVGRVAFAGDLLDSVRANGNVFEIVFPVDDGAWLEIDASGVVVAEGNLC